MFQTKKISPENLLGLMQANIVQTVQTKHKVWTKIQSKHEVWINAKFVFAKLYANLMQTKLANQWRTCLSRCLDSSMAVSVISS